MGSYDEGVLHNHIPCEEDGLCYYGNNTRASREATNQATKLVNLAIGQWIKQGMSPGAPFANTD